jgi:hypothetical protein
MSSSTALAAPGARAQGHLPPCAAMLCMRDVHMPALCMCLSYSTAHSAARGEVCRCLNEAAPGHAVQHTPGLLGGHASACWC